MKQTITIEGLSELQDGLLELTKATSTNVQKRALTKAAEPILDAAIAGAPVLTGRLKKSLIIGTRLSRWQKSGYRKESAIEVFAGGSSLGIFSEFGTAHQSPRPFMRPAWNSNKISSLNMIRQMLADEIEKARQRIARKTARLAANKGL